MNVLVQTKKLCKEYGDFEILKGVDLEVREGEKIGLVGKNGAGKTTLAKLLVGELEATSGELMWFKKAPQVLYMQQATEYCHLKASLSGGEKTKALLKETFLQKGDLLILDEPTNHLDSEGIRWLIRSLKSRKEAVLVISHDRYFLDQCVERIVEIEEGKLQSYEGNYSFYYQEKKRCFEAKLHAYYEQEKVKARVEGQIAELRSWSGKAHREAAAKAIEMGNKMGGKQHNRAKAKKMDKQIKSRIKRLEKLEQTGLSKPKAESSVFFELQEGKKTGTVFLEAKELGKSYPDKCLFEKSFFYIKRGEKVGLYGPNGCGKSTFIKGLLGQVSLEGELYCNLHQKIGYISQEVIDLDETQSILGLFDTLTREERGKLGIQLCQLGFSREEWRKKVACLSLGERMKLKLLLMIRQGCEALLLDEPTNHIDLHVREQLEEVLKDYKGTILLVTHDRYMLEKICDKLLVFEEKRIKRYEYTLSEYEEKKKSLQQTILQKRGKERQEELLRQQNKMAYLIGALSQVAIGSPEYQRLDEEYEKLLALRKWEEGPYYFRLVDEEDKELLEAILYESIYVGEGEKVPRDIIYKPEVYKYIANWGQKGDLGYVLVDKKTHEGIGVAWIRVLDGTNKGYAYRADAIPEFGVALFEAYRGKGLGTQLIKQLLSQLPSEVKAISLSVDQRNPAKGLYERLGFKTYSEDEHSAIMKYIKASDN